MATRLVTLPHIGTVTLYKRRGNRSLRLSIGVDGRVRVSMPHWLPYRAAEQFALSKRAWIEANQSRASAVLTHGQTIGKAHRLAFITAGGNGNVQARVIHNEVRVQHPAGMPACEPGVQRAAHAAAIRALRKEAETLLPQRLRSLAKQNGLTYRSVHIKQLKSRWGSCSTAKDITLNLFLMQLPWHLIDYVLLHELTHTRVMRHGTPFWQEMERLVPHAKQLRREIGGYQPALAAAA